MQTSFMKSEIVTGNVVLKAQTTGITGAVISFKFGTNSYAIVPIIDNQFELNFDTTGLSNGITTFEVKAEHNGTTYTDSVIINIVNYHSSENWRLLITEILPNPTVVSDSDGEFIQISNSFPFDLIISNWTVQVQETVES